MPAILERCRQARQARRLDEEVRHRRSSVEEVLQAVSAEDVDALQDRLAEAEFRVRRARDEMEKLRVLHPELPGDDVDLELPRQVLAQLGQ